MRSKGGPSTIQFSMHAPKDQPDYAYHDQLFPGIHSRQDWENLE